MNMKSQPGQVRCQRGVALVIVLTFVVLLTVVVVAYFSRVMNSRQLANDSFNGGKTDQLARNAMDVIVNDFKQEIVNGSTATTVNGVTTYYPAKADGTLLRANMVPMRSGTNDAIPNLIRRSVYADPMASPGVASRASKVNSADNASINGRIVSLARWNKHYLIPQADPTGSKSDPVASFTAPDWVMMTKEEGPAVLTTPTQDAAGKTVTPVGRYAYAVYDEGGLLDANLVGFPTGTILTQSGTKGLLASVDLTQLHLDQAKVIDQLVGWRNYATSQPGGSFGGFGFDTGGSNAKSYYAALAADTTGFLKTSTQVYQNRTDQKFFSRGQLLAFEQSIQQQSPGFFPPSTLQYLGTFSRELNAPSWGPTQNAKDMGGNATNMSTTTPNATFPAYSVAYYDNRNTDGYPNRFFPGVLFKKAGTVTGYDAAGLAYQYTVKVGDLLVQRRFPLSRLVWVGPNGPRNGGTAQNIQACFGLVWGPANDAKLNPPKTPSLVYIWKYCGPSGTTEAGAIETLDQIAAENREPNFFELLQAGVLKGSLGMLPYDSSPVFTLTSDEWSTLQLLRIGATIITQSQQPDGTFAMNYPTAIEYGQYGLPVIAVGTADLPYLNMFNPLSGAAASGSSTPIQVYLALGLWNPYQTVGNAARPNVRLRLEGSASMMNRYGDYAPAAVTIYNFSSPGYSFFLSAQISLSNTTPPDGTGVNGFNDPHALLQADVQSSLSAGSAGLDWGLTPAINGTQYVAYRLPDFNLDLKKHPGPKYPLNPANGQTTDPNSALWSWMYYFFDVDKYNHPFNAWLEFQNPAGSWIPYSYFAGVNHQDPGLAKYPGLYSSYMGADGLAETDKPDVPVGGYSTNSPLPAVIDVPTGFTNLYYYKVPVTNTDPRSLRFNYGETGQKSTYRPADYAFLNSSTWSAQTNDEVSSPTWWGRAAAQWGTSVPWGTGVQYFGSSLARNNASVPNVYSDPDGVQRIADSGLYADNASVNGWLGDPYALAGTPNIDRPIAVHGAFTDVAELGYVSRDYPWRTLDFFTAKSADVGLLDIFTAYANTGPVSAGHINLNSRNVTALTAVLSGAATKFIAPTATSDQTTRPSPPKMVSVTDPAAATGGPLINKSEIATRVVSTEFVHDRCARFGIHDER